ncbi:S35F4 protein, partial [Tricholaema leucomelas]|nr:S35F4 protein [Tricholaema leucomelas]
SRSSVIQCKPGGNCPSRHRGMTRQLSPLSVAEDSAAPILELQNRSPSGICRHSRVERQSRSDAVCNSVHKEASLSQHNFPLYDKLKLLSTFPSFILSFLPLLFGWLSPTGCGSVKYLSLPLPSFHSCVDGSVPLAVALLNTFPSLFLPSTLVSELFSFRRECSRIFGEDGLTLKLFLKRTAPFSILWTLTNYLYLLALKKLTATDVSALFCCNKAFVFLLSWIVLKDRFMGARIVAAIMAITGIVMMAYADGFQGDSIIGVAYAVGSASTSALYKVLFKMFLGSANFGEAAHFVSTLGFFNLIFISVTPIILYFTKVEYWSPFSAVPWGYLCGVAGLWLAFNILVNVGVMLTYPILISIGTVLSVPGNAAVDLLKHKMIFSVVRLGATIIICIGFLLMLLPEEWDEITLRFINSLKEKKSEDHADDITDTSVHTRSRSRANGTVSIPLA